MKIINLTKNQIALIDDEDYDLVSQYRWYAAKKRNTWYAATTIWGNGKDTKQYLLMHRLIAKPTGKSIVDHIDRNGLNNQKNNLRICTNSLNLRNCPRTRQGRSGYRGVTSLPRDRWLARINHDGKHLRIGMYTDKEEAARAYDVYAVILYGPFSHTNFPIETTLALAA